MNILNMNILNMDINLNKFIYLGKLYLLNYYKDLVRRK